MAHANTAMTDESMTVGVKRLATYGLLAVLLASAVNGLVRVFALSAAGVPLLFPLEWGPVIASSAIAAIGATLVYGVITRVSTRPNRRFMMVAVVILLLSFAGPLNYQLSPPPGVAEVPWAVTATLGVMHVASAAAIVGVLTGATGRSNEQGKRSEYHEWLH